MQEDQQKIEVDRFVKVIALMPVLNSEWVLRSTLPQMRRFVDDVIALDGHSTDGSADYIRSLGGEVIPQEGRNTHFAAWRQQLLDRGRAKGATHQIWLDADEAFTTNFLTHFRTRLEAMKPGQKLMMDWITLWKDPRQMRADDSIWSRGVKDFVFCDDGMSNFDSTWIHEGRTPGSNEPSRQLRVEREIGSALHFQFVPFQLNQAKQAYLRCQELLRGVGAWDINAKYFQTHDSESTHCAAVPAEWLEGFQSLDSMADASNQEYLRRIFEMFDQHGIRRFEPLDIWHIPKLEEVFAKQVGRQPRPLLRAPVIQRIRHKIHRIVEGIR